MAKEIAEEYASSLADLTVNSKPLINMLTILAEENVDHAGVIVETVEKHLEKVNPDIKLPVLYLVDSIIKNVGGAYTPKFSQSIVSMFTKTFKQVDEKTRAQMFKLRETWHDVFPATKLYQLDVKVNLIDPAWPIIAQAHQANIHVNPNFLKKSMTGTTTASPEEEEKMRSILAKKEAELLMLQKKKVEMELEQMKRQLQLEKVGKQLPPPTLPVVLPTSTSMPVAMVSPVAPVVVPPEVNPVPVKARLGPPVGRPSRIAPVSAALAAARRDPRLARLRPPSDSAPTLAQGAPPVAPPIAPNVFDIKPLDRVTKRKNVITIDVSEPRRRDPRLDPKARKDRQDRRKPPPPPQPTAPLPPPEHILDKLQAPDPRRINKLPPIPKINRDKDANRESNSSPSKRKKETRERKRREEKEKEKDGSSSSSPEKRTKTREIKRKRPEPEEKPSETEPVAFKELKNYHKERYMRRNKEKSESPEPPPETENDPSNVPEQPTESKDVDLRVLPIVEKPSPVAQKRPSTEAAEAKVKRNKLDKFDILFGNEDVDLRQLPQVEEVNPPPPPSLIIDPPTSPPQISPKISKEIEPENVITEDEKVPSPKGSPKRDWNEVKEKQKDEVKKTPTPLDLVRAKLAEATKGKDRLGRPLKFSKSPSIERERRRTLSSEDVDLRENNEDFDAEDHKKTISIIMSQAKEQFSDGQLDKNQYNALMYQVLQLNEKLKLKEAKQRESLEISKRKLKAHIKDENKTSSPKSSPSDMNRFGDIDERITPSVFVDTPPDSQGFMQDSDMRKGDGVDGMKQGMMPFAPGMPPRMYPPGPTPAFGPMWRGQIRPRTEEFGPRRFRPPYFRNQAQARPFPPRMPVSVLPTPQIGMCQGECPLSPYERTDAPPPLGAPNVIIPPTNFKVIEYIDQDPVKTIQIDGIAREIRFYGDKAIIMLDWDDPREIKFLPGCRRVTFDNKDSVVLSFNEGYKQVEIDDQVFDIKFGAPTRELYISRRWHECFFGGAPVGVLIDGKPRLVHLEGPLPQVDIGKVKRTDLVAGKINIIVNATQMCPVYLDAKVQKFSINNQLFTIRFVDALRTVLINEQPFKVEFGDLPKPIFVGNEKHFIRFSALPRNIRPGYVQIANMEGSGIPTVLAPPPIMDAPGSMEIDEPAKRLVKSPSPEVTQEHQGLDMLASVMPSSLELASGSDYSVANPIFSKPDKIPGLETSPDEKPAVTGIPGLGNLNVTDLFAKLVATGIVSLPNNTQNQDKDKLKAKPKEDKSVIHKVDLLKPETLRVKQPGLVAKLYGGMQCSGCGCRFPPEQTVRYSQHLDWHFRQNRRERDSARRAHSRHWHYDLADWLQYEEIDEIEDREKNWFECNGEEQGSPASVAAEAPSVAAGAPADCRCHMCGDKFDQFYDEDKEEWHLRNSIRHDDNNYHPICYEDYKASLAKEETKKEEILDEIISQEKPEEAIEIRDADDTQSDDESVVEVVEHNLNDKPIEQLEILENEDEEGDDDDVVLKAEPVEQVLVEDNDTDDETSERRGQRDRLAADLFAQVKVKQEPIDPDDEPIITSEEQVIQPLITATHTVTSSIDGNMQFDDLTPPTIPTGGIRINISKSIPTFISNNEPSDLSLDDISADDEPLPPGEEPELDYKLKPSLEGVQFSRQPPIQKGNELSGLCSIM